MTAEVAILNKEAVALAADSAATLSNNKIFDTVNKLFMLSKVEPIGLMIYSSAEITAMPAETVIKVYREERGTKSFDTLHEYAEDFIAFCLDDRNLFPDELRLHHYQQVLFQYYDTLARHIRQKVEDEFEQSNEVTDEEVERITNGEISSVFKSWQSAEFLPECSEQSAQELARAYKDLIVETRKQVFQNLPLTKESKSHLLKLGTYYFLKQGPLASYTGIVVAGFGRKEYFPRLRSFHYCGGFGPARKFERRRTVDIDFSNSASVVPFAQSEMVTTFMEGLAPDIREFLPGFLEEAISKIITTAAENSGEAIPEHLEEASGLFKQHMLDQLQQQLAQFCREVHIDPIITTVASLPKEELAIMAEALVNLTSIKRRMSPDAETVGGPTDVAIITKGDGFVWIKRKHYFDIKLNPHFIHNYFRGIDQ